jgi:hypothetical protein
LATSADIPGLYENGDNLGRSVQRMRSDIDTRNNRQCESPTMGCSHRTQNPIPALTLIDDVQADVCVVEERVTVMRSLTLSLRILSRCSSGHFGCWMLAVSSGAFQEQQHQCQTDESHQFDRRGR